MDYPITDVLQMTGKANRPLVDDTGRTIRLTLLLLTFKSYHHVSNSVFLNDLF